MAEIIFPENSSDIIEEILEKEGLSEDNKEFFRKVKKGGKPNIQILAELVSYRGKGDLSKEEFPVSIKLELNTTLEKAEKIAQELENKLIPRAKTMGEKEEKSKKSPPKLNDIYREKID